MRANQIIIATLIFLTAIACHEEVIVQNEESTTDPSDTTNSVPAGDLVLTDWTSDTHSNDGDPNYDLVFDQSKVHRIDIVLTAEEHQTMQSDLATLASQNRGKEFTSSNPVYVEADFYYEGKQWYNVGLRYKGNSSLYSVYPRNGKLPLRLKFDKFEDNYPQLLDQRFHGFKDLSLSSGFNDESFMREKTATDLFRSFGVPAPQTAFYEVYVDEGSGTPQYYGLYTMVEVIFDSMLGTQFGSNNGNCYKPDGDGAKFHTSGFTLDHFEKKTNELEADWQDIQSLYDVLHSSQRTSNLEQWKTDLEAVFDVDHFLKYLAVNNTIQNWDTYGNMTHNYYLYNNPSDNVIKWIPWDNNEAFTSGKGADRQSLSFEMDESKLSTWPLISFIVDIEEYRNIYDGYVENFITNTFNPDIMDAKYESMNALIAASVEKEESGYTFLTGSTSYSSALSTLKSQCQSRVSSANSYLNK